MKLNTFSCNLLKINSIRGFSMCMWQLKHCFHLSHLYIHTHRRAHTHTHTHTYTHTHSHSRRLKFCKFLERSRNQIHEQLIQHRSAKFNTSEIQIFLNENIRFNEYSGQIERNELTYLYYLKKRFKNR